MINKENDKESKDTEKKETPKKQLGDKIFGAHNNYIKDSDYNDRFDVDQNNVMFDEYYDEETYNHKKKLEEFVYEAFQDSRWATLGFKKKIPKDLVPHLFKELIEKLEIDEYTFCEKFVGICDYIQISYIKAYEAMPIKYKEFIINDLEVKYKILTKRNIKKLF